MEVPECEVVPGETARFPFIARYGDPPLSVHEFGVSSENPGFDPGWVRIVKMTDGTQFPRYALEIRPGHIRRPQFGRYPVWLRWEQRGAAEPAFARCTLVIKPCVRLKGKPTLRTWPGGRISLALENCAGAGVDVSVSVSHRGSSWSKGWEFELETGAGPVKFKESFEPPADGSGGEFDLDISAEGISLIHISLRPNNLGITRKQAVAAAVALAGAAGGITLVNLPIGSLAAQSISFTSQPSSLAVGARYPVSARGGGSGNPVLFSIDPSSSSVCSLPAPATVTFDRPGTCVIDANQAGNDQYQPASQAQQEIAVAGAGKKGQSISFTSQASGPVVGGTYQVSARGGGSGNQVVFSIDPSSASMCSLSGSTVTFSQAGTCAIDANQAGNDQYLPASQAQQRVTVSDAAKLAQSISFTSQASGPIVGGTYQVSARGGGSGNQVVFSIDPSSASICSLSAPATVTFNQAGSCVVDAVQAGNDRYQPAPKVQQTIAVKQTQTITFGSPPPDPGFTGGTYTVMATATSKEQVSFSADPSSVDSSGASVCSVSGSTVTFSQAGTCIIDANQAGDNLYLPAQQAQQKVTVEVSSPGPVG